jgi:hypothetical protein
LKDDLVEILDYLADGFCERRSYKCLLRFLPAYYSLNGLTDGLECCRKGLADTRALCRDDLKEDEIEKINQAINLIDRALSR